MQRNMGMKIKKQDINDVWKYVSTENSTAAFRTYDQCNKSNLISNENTPANQMWKD